MGKFLNEVGWLTGAVAVQRPNSIFNLSLKPIYVEKTDAKIYISLSKSYLSLLEKGAIAEREGEAMENAPFLSERHACGGGRVRGGRSQEPASRGRGLSPPSWRQAQVEQGQAVLLPFSVQPIKKI